VISKVLEMSLNFLRKCEVEIFVAATKVVLVDKEDGVGVEDVFPLESLNDKRSETTARACYVYYVCFLCLCLLFFFTD
jgi:hypothetical protein